MRKTHLPCDLREKYFDLKFKRDFCLKHRDYVVAFYHQVQIIEFYNNLPHKYQRKEEITDHYQIGRMLVVDCFDNADENLFNCLYCDVAVGLGYNTTLQDFKNDEYMISVFCVHINVLKFLYWAESPKDEIEQYMSNLLSAYRHKYGYASDEYLKLCLHLMFEGIAASENFQYAQNLFNEHIDRFALHLADYDFTYEVLLGFANAYIEVEDFDSVNELIDLAERSSRQLINHETQELVRLHCIWVRAKILSVQGQCSKSEEYCAHVLESIDISDPIYPEVCAVMVLNCKHSGRDYSEWVEKGIAFCNAHNYKNSVTYYRLLSGLAAVEYLKGNTTAAISHAKEVIEGMEKVVGKDSNAYVAAIVDYFTYLDNEKVKQKFIEDIKDTIDKHPYVKAHTYNILAFNLYNKDGKPTSNIDELEAVARGAVDASDATAVESLKIITRTTLLGFMVRQVEKCDSHKVEIEELFSFLEANKDEMDNSLRYAFNVCYIIYYCNKGQFRRALEIAENVRNSIVPAIEIPELVMRFDGIYIEVLLANEMRCKAITFLDSQINKIAENPHTANLTSIGEYLLFALSVVSQYGKGLDCYNELSYKCALMLKHINVKLHPDFERNTENFDMSRQISALELRQMNVDAYKKDNELDDALKALRYKLNYSSDKEVRLPHLKDINLPKSSVLLDVCLFSEVKHGELVGFQNVEERILSTKLAVFATYSGKDGHLQTVRLTDINWEAITEIYDLVDDNYSASDLRRLYDLFFDQLETYLTENDTLYLSLDYALPVIPFGTLIDCKNTILIEKCTLINVLVATDIRPDFHVALENVLLMGNPRYSIDKKYNGEVWDLPYTEVEVNQIEEITTSAKKYLRERAKKDAFYDNLDSNIIHISSHGKLDDFDPDKLHTPLIGSSVLLSGCIDFFHNDKKEGYGNGLLTAEDIIGLELDKTSLVVFSTCESGSGYSDDSTSIPKGLRWALGFTGVKASVSSMFEVDDVATAIFMVLFYRNLKNLPVAKALNEAKKQLRNLSVRDIRLDDVLSVTFAREFTNQHSSEKPFFDLDCWGAFDCYFYG